MSGLTCLVLLGALTFVHPPGTSGAADDGALDSTSWSGRIDTSATRTASIPPVRVAGLLPLREPQLQHWCWSGAWVYPVGPADRWNAPDTTGDRPFVLLRSVLRDPSGRVAHQGADLGNQTRGGAVRAAAHGLVVRVGWESGYGNHIVLAHRLGGDSLAYSVYAHLARRATLVREGEMVEAGRVIGRIGRTGRATNHHLHFEIRLTTKAQERWEFAAVTDPLAFIAARLPAARRDTSELRPWLEWAQLGGLLTAESGPDDPLDRRTWWTMLLRAARHSLIGLPDDTGPLRAAMIASGFWAEGRASLRDRVGWSEMFEDLQTLARIGVRLPLPALGPLGRRDSDARRDARMPRVADACLAVAEVAARPDPLIARSR